MPFCFGVIVTVLSVPAADVLDPRFLAPERIEPLLNLSSENVTLHVGVPLDATSLNLIVIGEFASNTSMHYKSSVLQL